MSKVVLLCYRSGTYPPGARSCITHLSQRLTPDNITAKAPLVIEGEGIQIGIINPVGSFPIKKQSVCLGMFFGITDDWWKPGADAPDGSYALFRSDSHRVELVSDILASRTIWYVKTDKLFIASTSQRAIIFFLQSYEPNKAVYPWMLSSGTLGPGLSWDQRIQCVPGDARLVLDRAEWKLKLTVEPVSISPLNLTEQDHEKYLREVIKETFDHLDLDLKRWVLPLSGGHDSRGILQILKGRTGLKAVTWGLRSAMHDKKSDAWLARELALGCGIPHEYLETDLSNEPVEQILRRFLVAGEGRVDHISGYADGFSVWRQLYESGINGVIRGDQAFGWKPAINPFQVRNSVGLMCLSDYRNLRESIVCDLYEQGIPEAFLQRDEESLEDWRDRLYHGFRSPVVLAALNELKSPYVEIINPFLSRTIINQVRQLPDYLRTDKRLFKKVVSAGNTNIPFAEHRAIDTSQNILKNTRVVNVVTEEILSDDASRLLSPVLVTFLLKNMKVMGSGLSKGRPVSRRIKTFAKKYLPAKATKLVKTYITSFHNTPPEIDIDANNLAFRAYIICKMNRLLREDAKAQGINRDHTLGPEQDH